MVRRGRAQGRRIERADQPAREIAVHPDRKRGRLLGDDHAAQAMIRQQDGLARLHHSAMIIEANTEASVDAEGDADGIVAIAQQPRRAHQAAGRDHVLR
jgi:hypothetical protein